MSTNISLFAQVIRLLPRALIKKLSTEFQVDKHSKHFTSWQHWVSMIFSQFSGCVSLREISNGLRSATGNLNHLGIHTAPSKSNLAYQNEHRTSDSEPAIMPCSIISDSRALNKGVGFVLSNPSNSWTLQPLHSVSPYMTGLNTRIQRGLLNCIHS